MKKTLLVVVVLAGLTAYVGFDLGRFLSIEALAGHLDQLKALDAAHPVQSAGLYFVVYVSAAALSVPGATVLTLLGGALYGLGKGVLLVSFASTIGATLAFLIARGLLRDVVEGRFGNRVQTINRGIERDGAFYLFSLRLVPLFPFFVVNLVLGLTRLPTRTFYWVSQLGMFPATVVYVNAGRELGHIEAASDIASPTLLMAFALLGLFPWLARVVMAVLRRRRLYAPWPAPSRFDRNLVVIGAGSGGLVSAYIAAALKAKVTLIEKDRMGGDCLNTGCVPSKALLRSARAAAEARKAERYGVSVGEPVVDFAAVMGRVRETIAAIEPHDSEERYRSLGVEVLRGEARVVSPWAVRVGGTTLTTRAIVVATGGRPAVPPIPGLSDTGYCTSDTIWELTALPPRLTVLGGGPIGCELAQAFARLGAEVTLLQRGRRLLPKEDEAASEAIAAALTADGVRLRFGVGVLRASRDDRGRHLHCEADGLKFTVSSDELLVATGRRGGGHGLGLETLGIVVHDDGTVETGPDLATRYPNILACGDVAGPYQYTHAASHQAWFAAVNGLFGSPLKRFVASYDALPHCTYTSPEVARVGLGEAEARASGLAFETTRFELSELDRAIIDGQTDGYVQVLTAKGSDRILGVTIVAEHAGELIAEFVLAKRHGLGLNKVLGTIHGYPTMMEANRYAAGAWKRAHAPERLLHLVAAFHRLRRRAGRGS